MPTTIPALSGVRDPAVREILRALIQNQEELLGQRGDPESKSRAATVAELDAVSEKIPAASPSNEPRFTKWLERGGARKPKCLTKGNDFALTSELSGSCLSNHEAKQNVRFSLPPAKKGMSFMFIRETPASGGNYWLRVYPSQGDSIWKPSSYGDTPTPNYGLSLNTFRARVKLSSHVDGVWSIESQDGTIGHVP